GNRSGKKRAVWKQNPPRQFPPADDAVHESIGLLEKQTLPPKRQLVQEGGKEAMTVREGHVSIVQPEIVPIGNQAACLRRKGGRVPTLAARKVFRKRVAVLE